MSSDELPDVAKDPLADLIEQHLDALGVPESGAVSLALAEAIHEDFTLIKKKEF